MPGVARSIVHVDAPDSDPRTTYLHALLHHPEVATLPFPERPDGVPFTEMYVDQTVVEERRQRQSVPTAEDGVEQALHTAMMREVVQQVEVDLWDKLRTHHRVLVEAPAWTGKSTLCRWITQQCCNGHPDWLPILLPFRDFAQSGTSLRRSSPDAWCIDTVLSSGLRQQKKRH